MKTVISKDEYGEYFDRYIQYSNGSDLSELLTAHRDEMMGKLAKTYPGYGWEKNVGYPTQLHRDGIRKLGPSPIHRKSFRLLPDQLEIDFPKSKSG